MAVLKGKKTYVAGVLGLLGVIGAVLTGDISYTNAVIAAVPIIQTMFVRSGISNDTQNLLQASLNAAKK